MKHLLDAVTAVALSFGLLMAALSKSSDELLIAASVALGLSFGYPIGFVIGGKNGAGIGGAIGVALMLFVYCLLYTSPSPRDRQKSRMPSSA